MDNYENINIMEFLNLKQTDRVWFDANLPSNGFAGYSSKVKIREMNTEDEKNMIKEIFGNKENSKLNLISKNVIFEEENFNINKLTTFDRDFLLLELSSISFPGKKEIIINDEIGHTIQTTIDKDDLTLNIVEKSEVPYEFTLPYSNLKWSFNFLTIEKLKKIEEVLKFAPQEDFTKKLYINIAGITEKIIYNNKLIKVDNMYDYVRIIEGIKNEQTGEIKSHLNGNDRTILIKEFNNFINKYGYYLKKQFYCDICQKQYEQELDPFDFFRFTPLG